MALDRAFIEQLNQMGRNGVPFLFIIDFEGRSPRAHRLTEIPAGIRFSLAGSEERKVVAGPSSPPVLIRHPVSFDTYHRAFRRVLHHLRQGNSYLVNLTFPTPIETRLSLEEIFRYSRAPYKLLVPGSFVVFSPEPFVRIRNNAISSFPMKGTIDASVPDAVAKVLSDPKESAEHTTIVDLIRNDLSRVADRVEVARFRYIERIRVHDRELIQVSSEIKGRMDDDWRNNIGTILDALLPAGSVSGAPKQSTLEIIREAETGPSVFDGTGLYSAVMIRFIEQTATGLQYRSGGGITHLSDPEGEYREMVQKVYLPFQ
jgi:para-aminobenzoate synthetase component I